MEQKKKLRILITGSRNYPSKLAITRTLTSVAEAHPDHAITLVSGAARGADTYAEEVGETLGFTIERHPADWDTHGKKAGIIRNLEMVKAGADLCIAYPFGSSRGTAHCATQAVAHGIPTHVVTLDSDGSYTIEPSQRSDWFRRASQKKRN